MTLFVTIKLILIHVFLLNRWIHQTTAFITDDCGVLDEIPGEIRTQTPWTAAIFYRNSMGENFTYQAAGIIVGPTTVLTVFAGVHGKLPRKVKGRYSIQSPSNTLIAAGVEEGDLEKVDKHAQFTQVTFVEPYMGIEDQDKEYHFALLHLKTPFDFSTPYVRQLCVEEVGENNLKSHSTPKANSTVAPLLQGGFAKYKIKSEDNQTSWGARLKLQRIEVKSGYDCVQKYENFYYNSAFPLGMFCAQLPEGSATAMEQDLSCLLHGSAIVRRNNDFQWYLVGLTTLIRGRKGGFCRNDTVYFNARLSYTLEWIRRSLRCSPFSFSCGDGSCTSLEAVCNSVPNCADESDEEERFCQANNRCKGNTPHQCNLLGEKCISREAVCDGRADCDDGSDEVMCQDQAGRRTRDATIASYVAVCPSLTKKQGVHIEYMLSDKGFKVSKNVSVIPVNTFAYLKCKNFYKSKYIYNHIENQCVDEGTWSSFSPFECEADCGMPNRIKNSEIPDTENKLDPSDLSFPWNSLLFSRNESRDSTIFEVMCAATLISKSQVITGADCFLNADKNSSITAENVIVVLNPSSEIFSQNLDNSNSLIFNAESILFNAITPGNSTIGIVKFFGEVEYSQKIRPVCISHSHEAKEESAVKKIDWRLRSKINMALKGMHVSEFPFVVEVACIRRDFHYASDLKCIGHHRGMSISLKYLGGALVTQERTKFGTRFSLKGILQRIEDTIAHFSSVEQHMEWIESQIN